MRIYTKTGDGGETGLWGKSRTAKSHPRIAALGDIDETNSFLGLALSAMEHPSFKRLKADLERVQKELFAVGALLAAVDGGNAALTARRFERGVPQEWTANLESAIDAMDKDLKPLKNFILPGGCEAAARLFAARAVCRRAERSVCALQNESRIPDGLIAYLNRLSDYLFVAARQANAASARAETAWEGLR